MGKCGMKELRLFVAAGFVPSPQEASPITPADRRTDVQTPSGRRFMPELHAAQHPNHLPTPHEAHQPQNPELETFNKIK